MTTAIVPFNEMQGMAEAIAKSGLFGIKRPEEALALMLVAASEGRHPGSVAAEYHIIQGRPALKADAMLARFQNAGGSVDWKDYADDKVTAIFSHPQGGSVTVSWDMERAKKAELGGKDNWKKYQRQMLRARVISEGVRTCYPAVCVGVYTIEEVQDFDDAPKRVRKEKDMGAATVVPAEISDMTRETQLDMLAKENGKSAKFYLNRAGVETASAMSEEDWAECVASIKRSIAAKAEQQQQRTAA